MEHSASQVQFEGAKFFPGFRMKGKCINVVIFALPWVFITFLLLPTPSASEVAPREPGLNELPVILPISASGNATNSTTGGGLEPGKGFVHAFIAALSIVVVSEIGDKTFFIAAIMAMRHPRSTVFLGAISALFLMTALSAALGYAVTVIPKIYTYYISSGLFAIFGIKMLIEGIRMKPDEGQEELEEVQSDIRRREEEAERSPNNAEAPRPGSSASNRSARPGPSAWKILARVFLQAFTMTFLAEWGDRSQISTIVLAATENVWGVTLGGTLGHSLCTGVAVIGGRMVAQRISVKTVTIIGGVVFLLFALSSLFIGPGGFGAR